ncbi:hypothetical protein Taro_054508 [Colocasia esculenta]|uniref:Uncharacterized protein n=1 Tax=Colocasia esculenta TaxID=4460 RepID=A0A843XRE7_COLES|nr:hypothetical protein [Colocasia esculenta]
MSGFLSRQTSLRGSRGYRRLGRQASSHFPEEGEPRAEMVDQQQLGAGSKKTAAKKEKKSSSSRGSKKSGSSGKDAQVVHPVQRVLDARRMDKAMAKPEFVRYLAYVKEAGRWDGESDHPVIFFD